MLTAHIHTHTWILCVCVCLLCSHWPVCWGETWLRANLRECARRLHLWLQWRIHTQWGQEDVLTLVQPSHEYTHTATHTEVCTHQQTHVQWKDIALERVQPLLRFCLRAFWFNQWLFLYVTLSHCRVLCLLYNEGIDQYRESTMTILQERHCSYWSYWNIQVDKIG